MTRISSNVVDKFTRFCSSATAAVRYYRTGPTLVHVGLGLHLCPTAPTANPIPPGLQQRDAIYWRRVQISSYMEPRSAKLRPCRRASRHHQTCALKPCETAASKAAVLCIYSGCIYNALHQGYPRWRCFTVNQATTRQKHQHHT